MRKWVTWKQVYEISFGCFERDKELVCILKSFKLSIVTKWFYLRKGVTKSEKISRNFS